MCFSFAACASFQIVPDVSVENRHSGHSNQQPLDRLCVALRNRLEQPPLSFFFGSRYDDRENLVEPDGGQGGGVARRGRLGRHGETPGDLHLPLRAAHHAHPVLEERVQGEGAGGGREAALERRHGLGELWVFEREGGGAEAGVDVGLQGGHGLRGGVADQPLQVLQAQNGEPEKDVESFRPDVNALLLPMRVVQLNLAQDSHESENTAVNKNKNLCSSK